MGLQSNDGEIFIDATLTDLGREKLARNDGSFLVVKYRLGDDEIDYRNWNELTGSTAKDSTILDTPLFEALSNEAVGIKNPLITIRNAKLQFIPSFVSKPSSISLRENDDSLGGGVDVTVYQEFARSQVVVPSELVDVNYFVKLDNDLLFIDGETPVSITSFGSANYIIPAAPNQTTSAGGTILRFTVRVAILTSELFDVQAGVNAARPRSITTNIDVVGQQSGLVASIPVTIVEFANS